MPKPLFSPAFLVIILCFYSSCTTTNQINHPDWDELQLPAGWSIKAPKGFKVKTRQGIDSYPGVICNNEDSIVAYFDSGASGRSTERNLSNIVKKKREEIEQEWFKNLYKIPEYNIAYLDTIDGDIAIIVKPENEGKKILDISISNRKTGAWLGVSRGFWDNQRISPQDESLLLEMFKTIKFNK